MTRGRLFRRAQALAAKRTVGDVHLHLSSPLQPRPFADQMMLDRGIGSKTIRVLVGEHRTLRSDLLLQPEEGLNDAVEVRL